MARSIRASAAAAAKKILAQAADDADTAEAAKTTRSTRPSAGQKRKRQEESDASEVEEDEAKDWTTGGGRRVAKKADRLDPDETKRRLHSLLSAGPDPVAAKKRQKRKKNSSASTTSSLAKRLFSQPGPCFGAAPVPPACCPPERRHSVDYHRPLLLEGAAGKAARRALLAWYDGASALRGMPWRREPWLDPASASTAELSRRAYEVWISEIMAQQTRIAVVIGYWTRWMARWPTMADLAVAEAHEVMHEWSGLGYYSRAARLHEAARVIVADPVFNGLLPADVATLEERVPGVGRYTAGAISAIVFGRAAAMVDGNVIRVLSRQLGLFADSKADKQLVDLLWAAAEALVQAVARDGDDDNEAAVSADDSLTLDAPISDRPGRWGQALMELGSTLCTPKPDCAACPISSTCRTYAEGLRLYEVEQGRGTARDTPMDRVESSCDLCEQFPELDDEEAAALAKADKKDKKDTKTSPTTSQKATAKSPFFDVEDAANGLTLTDEALATVVNHARTFPLRRPKKPVRVVDTLICAIRTKGTNKGAPLYLLHQRPDKGLLARLWQLPSYDLPLGAAADSKAARRKEAEAFVARWLDSGGCTAKIVHTAKVKELGSIPWLFSHLRQTMHVYLFEVDAVGGPAPLPAPAACSWASIETAEETYSMGTGMRKCWDLVKNS